jgi:elongation factor Ts
MSNISASLVRDLREKTGVGMMECKKALAETAGDMEKAIVWLREKGLARASKKSGRVTAEGLVQFAITPDHKSAAVVEVNCETDFAARNTEFIDLVEAIAKTALATKATSVETLAAAKLGDLSVGETLTNLIARIGENMTLRRVAFLHSPEGVVVGYSHMGGRIGALVALSQGAGQEKALEAGKDIAMHIAASAPKYLLASEVATAELDQEREIAKNKLLEEGKAANMIDKIVEGQVKKFYKEICLVEQPFVKDPKVSVQDWLKSTGTGGTITGFVRFQLGEGIEKQVTDFAAEVAAQIKA